MNSTTAFLTIREIQTKKTKRQSTADSIGVHRNKLVCLRYNSITCAYIRDGNHTTLDGSRNRRCAKQGQYDGEVNHDFNVTLFYGVARQRPLAIG
jgi:hypothetical protein